MPSSERRDHYRAAPSIVSDDNTDLDNELRMQTAIAGSYETSRDKADQHATNTPHSYPRVENSKGKGKQKAPNPPISYSRGESSKTRSRTETAKRDLHPEIFLTKTSKTLTTSDPPSSLEKDGSLHMMLLVMDDTAKKVAKVVNHLKSDASPAVTAKDVMKTYAHIMFAEGGYSEHGVRFQRAEPEREKTVKNFWHNVRMINEADRHGSHLKVVKGLLEPDITRGR